MKMHAWASEPKELASDAYYWKLITGYYEHTQSTLDVYIMYSLLENTIIMYDYI